MRYPRQAVLALIATLSLAVGCGGGGGTTTTTGSIALSLAPTGATIQQGGSTQVTGTVTRTDFTGDIGISVTGAPTGVTGTVTLAPVNGGNSAQVTLTAGSTTAVGTYTLTVIASGSGITSAQATFTLTITAATAASYTMTLGTPSQSIVQGGTAPSTITFVRTSFSGNITLSAENLPSGVTAVFSTNPAPGNSSSVTFTAASNATLGTFNNILIRGTAVGLTDVTASVTLTVTAAVSGGTVHLDYSLCTTGTKPVWVAYQDGSGAWTHVVGTADVYNFTINSAKGALAVVTPGSNFTTIVTYLTQSELAAYGSGCATTTGKTINGTLNGVTVGYQATVSMGGGATGAVGPATTFQLTGVASGAQDLVAYNRNANTPGAALDHVIIRRGLNIADQGSIPLLDFTSAEALSPTTSTITVGGATAGNSISQIQSYQTGTACTNHLLYTKAGTTTSIFAYGIPTANQLSTDFYRLAVTEQLPNSMSRSVTSSFHTLADRTITMGATFTPTSSDLTGAGAYVRLQQTFTMPSDYQSVFTTYSSFSFNTILISQSAGYIGGASSVTIAMPDLAPAGYLTSYGPPTGVGISVYTSATGNTLGGAGCTEGGITKTASVSFIF